MEQEQEKTETEEQNTADEVTAENSKNHVQTGYNASMYAYGLLALGSLLLSGFAVFRKRKIK